MASDSLEALEALHHDLQALRENRLVSIDRLSGELEAHIEEFKALLDHKKRNNESRKKIAEGKHIHNVTLGLPNNGQLPLRQHQ
jgi:hypothetical protein